MPSPSVKLRVGGGFVVLFAGGAGVLLPLWAARAHDAHPAPWLLLLKAFSAGVVLSLATVHLLNDAYAKFEGLTPGTLYQDYSITGVFVAAGVYVMFLTERLSLDAMASAEEEHCLDALVEAEEAVSVRKGEVNGVPGGAQEGGGVTEDVSPEPHSHEHLSALTAARSILAAHAGHAHGPVPRGGRSHAHGAASEPVPGTPSGHGEHGHGHSHSHGHAHGALVLTLEAAAASPSGSASTPEGRAAAAAARRRVMTARLLELSIVVHSVVIGLDLGTQTAGEGDAGSLRPIVALIILLAVHQFFEGVALGSFIADLRATVPLTTKLLMSGLFALTVPVGTWVGIGVSASYTPDSQAALWVTGTLDAVTGGMLLYTALITFMAEEFSRDDLKGRDGRRLKRKMYACMLLGASCMALLGVWA